MCKDKRRRTHGNRTRKEDRSPSCSVNEVPSANRSTSRQSLPYLGVKWQGSRCQGRENVDNGVDARHEDGVPSNPTGLCQGGGR